MTINYISLAAGIKTSPINFQPPNNIKSSSILKRLKVAEEEKSLKYAKVFEEAFQRHFWPQGCKVPTKVALLQNSLKRVKLPLTSQNPNRSVASSPLVPFSANPDLNIQPYSP